MCVYCGNYQVIKCSSCPALVCLDHAEYQNLCDDPRDNWFLCWSCDGLENMEEDYEDFAF